jgi:putative colanic acid biosynthesis glycosyltransferase WcaI
VDIDPMIRNENPRSARFRLAIVSCVFPPEFTYSATLAADLAQELASAGHQVTVLTPFPNKPSGRLEAGTRRSLYRTVEHDGFRQIRCLHTLAPKSTMLPRLLENLTFGIFSALRLLFLRKPDAVFMNTWPIFATALTVAVARLRHVPYIVYVADIYPESLVVQKRLSPQHWMVRALRTVDAWIAKHASAVFVLSHGALKTYSGDRNVPADRVQLVRNWLPKALSFEDEASQASFRKAKKIPADAFLAVYAGNVGMAAGPEVLVDAFALLRDVPEAYLLIAGSGPQLDECMKRTRESGNPRILFHHPWKQEETEMVLGSADLLLLPTIGVQSMVSVPSKLITYFNAGKPVLASVIDESETAAVIREANAGWIVPPENAAALATAIRTIMDLPPAEIQARGTSGRSYGTTQMSRDANLPKLLASVLNAATRQRTTRYENALARS